LGASSDSRLTKDRVRIVELLKREVKRFDEQHQKSKTLFERAKSSLLAGVPMNWLFFDWVSLVGAFPFFAKEAKGAHLIDVDGREYVDFCFGDTVAMFGHAAKPVVDAVTEQIARGTTMWVPTEDSVWVAEELGRRFGLPYWQFVLTATDANRFALRLAREVTGRKRVLVFNGCYHGTVMETLVKLRGNDVVFREGGIGSPPVDPVLMTKVIEFNDLQALEAALLPRDVACVLCEPVMTNVGIIFPDPGYHEALRAMTRRYGTLLIFDETHTICAGPGGYTMEHKLAPDVITIGKPIAGGVPAAAYGVSQQVVDQIFEKITRFSDATGLGGTLSGNALTANAMRTTLEQFLTKATFDRMIAIAERFVEGVSEIIRRHDLPWHVMSLGARVVYGPPPIPPRNAREALSAMDPELDKLIHLYLLNRGVMLLPSSSRLREALMSPYTTTDDIDLHTRLLEECVKEVKG
jgi:glutamate-1-semialdehyde 2,1-aminomutase